MWKRPTILVFLLSMSAMVVSIAQGQIPTGSLNGLVTDPKDAIVSSLDLRLKKDFHLGERASLSLIGEGFNMFNETNIRGSSNANYAGRNISIGPYQAAQNGQPAQTVQANFYSRVSTAGGFFGSGGPRAFQFAARIEF